MNDQCDRWDFSHARNHPTPSPTRAQMERLLFALDAQLVPSSKAFFRALLDAKEKAEYELRRFKEAVSQRPDWENLWEEVSAERDALRKENFALAADQCHAGYGDEHGNHRCKEVEQWKEKAANWMSGFADAKLEADALRKERDELAALNDANEDAAREAVEAALAQVAGLRGVISTTRAIVSRCAAEGFIAEAAPFDELFQNQAALTAALASTEETK